VPVLWRHPKNAAAVQLRGDAENGKDDLGKIAKSDVVEVRLGQGTNAGPGALHLAGDNQKVGCVARKQRLRLHRPGPAWRPGAENRAYRAARFKLFPN